MRSAGASQVRQPGIHTIEAALGRGSDGDVPTRLNCLVADQRAAGKIDVVEVGAELGEECGSVCRYCFLDPFADATVYAFRISRGFQQEWRNSGNQGHFAYAAVSVRRGTTKSTAIIGYDAVPGIE
jgi:hypothetical protein